MGFEVEFFPPSRIEIHVPLNPNLNDKGNAYAGSIYSSLVLAPWYLLTEITQNQGIDCKISVIYSTVKFRTPIEKDFTSHCEISDYGRLISELRERGRCRISANANTSDDDGNHACAFEGKYFLRAVSNRSSR
jgi:thioesterase domain-containing protein